MIYSRDQTYQKESGCLSMILLRLFFIAFLFMSISPSYAQDLSSHQWKDRLVIIQSNDSSNSLFKSQIEELKTHQEGLKNRRVVVYQSIPKKYKKGLGDDVKWEESGGIFKTLMESDSEFEIILIGLDGGIKLRKNELIKYEELFGVIDQMPMRKSEIKRRNKGDF